MVLKQEEGTEGKAVSAMLVLWTSCLAFSFLFLLPLYFVNAKSESN